MLAKYAQLVKKETRQVHRYKSATTAINQCVTWWWSLVIGFSFHTLEKIIRGSKCNQEIKKTMFRVDSAPIQDTEQTHIAPCRLNTGSFLKLCDRCIRLIILSLLRL